ncbi:hypothetical protein MKEN_00044600 [Mycena kentingensis (nom. inval.)]|nr:hypothetical protein MKEN_00044600 [Mycena kentingensis (nom. inval.)]
MPINWKDPELMERQAVWKARQEQNKWDYVPDFKHPEGTDTYTSTDARAVYRLETFDLETLPREKATRDSVTDMHLYDREHLHALFKEKREALQIDLKLGKPVSHKLAARGRDRAAQRRRRAPKASRS